MTFGEKLQGQPLERDETMPETDKVVALADLFGVTTDYLLRQQVENRARSLLLLTAHGSMTGWKSSAAWPEQRDTYRAGSWWPGVWRICWDCCQRL